MSNSPPPTTPTNQQGQHHSQTNPGNSVGSNHQASELTNTQNSTTTGANFFAMPGSPQEGRGFPYVTPLPSCLMPESFTGTSDFEEYLQQFNTAALLSGWHSNTHDNRPHYFALRLKENALHFYTTLLFEQQTNFDLLIEAFRQNYTTNGDILKARLKAAKQQPKQDIAAFLCDVRTLARRAYRDFPEMIDPMVLTTFVEGLSDKTLRWELRKAKPQIADDALTAAMELIAFSEIENGNSAATQSVNRVAQGTSNETLEELVRLLSQSLQNSQLQSPQVQPGSNEIKNMKRSRSLSNDSRSSTRSVRFQSPQERGRTNFRRSDNQNRDNGSSNQRKKRNEHDSNKSACKHCKRTNHDSKDCKACFNCLKPGHFRRDCRSKRNDSLN